MLWNMEAKDDDMKVHRVHFHRLYKMHSSYRVYKRGLKKCYLQHEVDLEFKDMRDTLPLRRWHNTEVCFCLCTNNYTVSHALEKMDVLLCSESLKAPRALKLGTAQMSLLVAFTNRVRLILLLLSASYVAVGPSWYFSWLASCISLYILLLCAGTVVPSSHFLPDLIFFIPLSCHCSWALPSHSYAEYTSLSK